MKMKNILLTCVACLSVVSSVLAQTQIKPPEGRVPSREEFKKNFVNPTDLAEAMAKAAIQGQYTGELNGPLAKKLREMAKNPNAQVLVSFVQDGGRPDCRHFDGKVSMPGLNNKGVSPVMKIAFHAGPRGNPCQYDEKSAKDVPESSNKPVAK